MRRLKIVFDAWVLDSRFSHHGTNVYARNVLKHMIAAARELPEMELCILAPGEAVNQCLLPGTNPASVVSTVFSDNGRSWRLGGMGRRAKQASADLVFSPSCNLFPSRNPPTVCTIHDATPMLMPSHRWTTVMAQRFFVRCAARRAVAIITVSERSRKDIIEHCGVPGEKVAIIYNGYDRDLFNAAPADLQEQRALRKRLGIRNCYAFHHGVMQPRKNLVRLIDAHRLLLSRHRDMQLDLVLAGPLGWQYEAILRSAQNARGDRGRVIIVGALSDSELSLLLKGATIAVIPSLYEGFCLPMIEAMACGIPTIASQNSCMPEVSGNALLYFDPLSIEEIASAMESVLFNRELACRIVAGGLDRVRRFSWERCARETLDILLQAATCTSSRLVGVSA